MYIGLHVVCPLFLSGFNENRIFLTDLRNNTQISNFMKICPMRAEFRADGRTDERTETTKLLFAFRNFANAPKITGNCSKLM
jgi:hypothetical protein